MIPKPDSSSSSSTRQSDGMARRRANNEADGKIVPESTPLETAAGPPSPGKVTEVSNWLHAKTASFEKVRAGSFHYLADNEFILSGYRQRMGAGEAFRSLFQLHNETSNVWSHLAGAIVFMWLFWHIISGGLASDYQVVIKHSEGLARLASTEILALKQYATSTFGAADTVVDGSADASGELKAAFHAVKESLSTAAESMREWSHSNSGAGILQQLQTHAQAAAAEAERFGVEASAAAFDRMHSLLRPLADTAHQLAALLPRSKGKEGGDAAVRGRAAMEAALAGVAAGVTKAWHALEKHAGERLGGQAQHGSGIEDRVSTLPLALFAASALICLSISSAFHLLHVMNRRVYEVLARADYTGIAVLIAGSQFPPVVYGLYCNVPAQKVYLVVSSIVCIATVILGMLDRFKSATWRPVRAGLFALAGATGVLPLTHMAMSTTLLQQPQIARAYWYIHAMAAQYLIGALIYAMRIPERWLPGRFDYLLQSHFIFHMLVWGAAWAHWRASLGMYEWRREHASCPDGITDVDATRIQPWVWALPH